MKFLKSTKQMTEPAYDGLCSGLRFVFFEFKIDPKIPRK